MSTAFNLVRDVNRCHETCHKAPAQLDWLASPLEGGVLLRGPPQFAFLGHQVVPDGILNGTCSA